MRKIMPILLTVVAMLSVCIFAKAGSSNSTSNKDDENGSSAFRLYSGDFDIVSAKLKLAEEHSDEITIFNDAEKAQALDNISDYLIGNCSNPNLKECLSLKGIYLLEIPKENRGTLLGSPADVTLAVPILCYYAPADCWGIFCQGEFKRVSEDEWGYMNWKLNYSIGKKYNHGGFDGYGYSIIDTNNNYHSALIKCYCKIAANREFTKFVQNTTNKNAGSGKDGIGFTLQDHAVVTYNLFFSWEAAYDAKYFALIGWYNGKFASYDGNVETFLIHTWSNTELQSIQFGVNGGGDTGKKISITGNVSAVFNRIDKQYHTTSAQLVLDNDERARVKMWEWKPSYSLSPGADDMDYDK